MTQIDFYFNAGDRLQVACRLAGKALAQGKRMLIYASDPELLSRIDKLLWTWPAVGFVPHCRLDDPLAPDTPVLLAGDERTPERPEVLLNLAAGCPPHFASFERLLEVVPADEPEREAGRERYRFYKRRGYRIAHHDLAESA
ncbi:MAG: DNA polymerase III subunit chi [Betaproteobacteria bacterium]